jgi:exopolysaccharide production protein ExoZ
MDRSPSRKKLNLLQGFRGIASLLVLLVHGTALLKQQTHQAVLGNWFSFGYTGVDFFFVLSGFIIYYIHHRDIGQPDRWRNFVSKRFWRVYPLYWLVLIPRLLRPDTDTSGWIIPSSLVLFPYPAPPIVNVSWTLTYEIFFYFAFSLLIGQSHRWFRGILATWLAIDAGYWLLHICGWGRSLIEHPVLYFVLSPFHLEFIMGCVAAYGVLNHRWKRSQLMMWTGVILFLGSGLVENWLNSFDLGQVIPWFKLTDANYVTITGRYSLLFFGLPAMLIILGAAAWESVEEIPLPPWFVYLGDASFSIYLLHGTVINNIILLCVKFNQQAWLSHFFVQVSLLGVALAGGCLFHQWVEKPLLRIIQKRLLPSKPIA